MHPAKIFILGLTVCTLSAFAGMKATMTVDAITSATLNNSCKFNLPIAATTTTATITWTEAKTGGSAIFACDTTNPPTNTRAVLPTERAASTIEVTGLKPATTYYIYIQMTKTGETPYGATGSFKTAGTTETINVHALAPQSVTQLKIVGKNIILGSMIQPGDAIVLSDVAGRTLFTHRIAEGESRITIPPGLATGKAAVRIMRGNYTIQAATFVNGL